VPTYADLTADVQSYTTYDEATFVAEIPTFIRSAEERIWYNVQLPYFRRAQTGAFTSGNQYLEFPDDFLAAGGLMVVVNNEYQYLLNKDVSYIREVYPFPTSTGVPEVYALFDDNTMIVGPTPDDDYAVELDYFYEPASLTAGAAGGTTWLSVNAYDTLLYGTLEEAANFMKRTAGIDIMGAEYGKRFLMGIQGLKNLGEARDRKDAYRAGEKRVPEA
jgi:hypothetical protein